MPILSVPLASLDRLAQTDDVTVAALNELLIAAREGEVNDHVLGCIVGGAVGDCLGSALEGQSAVDPEAIGLSRITDDTQLTLATLSSVAMHGLSPEHVAASLRQLYDSHQLRGAGSTTLKALRDLSAGAHWALSGRSGEHAAGNGAAMRVAPLAFRVDLDDLDERRFLRDVCRITHKNDEAWVGALAVVLAVQGPIGQPDWLRSIAEQLPDTKVRDRLQDLADLPCSCSIHQAARHGVTGYVVDSIPFALFAARQSVEKAFVDTIREVVLAGGDTDTNASIAGQVVGAHRGLTQLPPDIVALVPELDEIAEIGISYCEALTTGCRTNR